MINEFNELSLKRKSWVDTTKSNGFDNGIKNLLTELYPDNAHFIYELLQNAEDTEATEVKFSLKDNELIFQHNGRDFDFKDIEGITSIGQGTKKDDINKIGKFGVGFKAIFAYTNTPLIYSNQYNFSINDLVIPIEIDKKNYDYPTTMIFPFDNKNKEPQIAYQEIKKGLSSIRDNTLLFLKNINKINYEYENNLNQIMRDEIDNEKVSILNSATKEKTNWLRFKQFLPKSNNLFVSIAYKLEENIELKKEQIVPIDGEVSIYFPAEKETSKLRFHIHAPFSSTVARDSIKDIEENNILRDLISKLIVESFKYIKENDYLNFNFLQVLPIKEDNLAIFYEPILLDIIKTFNNEPYVLVEDKTFMPANVCYRASNKIKKLINENDLKYLVSTDKSIYWAVNPSQLNSREDKFLKQLKIENLTNEIFIERLEENLTRLNNNTKEFFETKDNEWFLKFYELMCDLEDKHYIDFYIFKKIIKLNNGNMNYTSQNCFFESTTQFVNTKSIVEPKTYVNSKKAQQFLEFLDVKTIDLKEEIKLILNLEAYEYSNYDDKNAKVSKTKHLEHWNVFLEYFKTESINLSLFTGKTILFNNQNKLAKPNEIILSKPYIENDLHLLDGIGSCFSLHDIYKDILNQEDFLEFIKKLGVLTSIPIKEQRIPWDHPDRSKIVEYGNVSDYTINKDYNIDDLEKIFKESNYEISLILWQTIISSDKNKQFTKYRRIKTSSLNSAPSSLIYNLKKLNWIPDKNNVFHKPSEISQQMLPKEFIYDDSKGWMSAIGLGEDIKKKNDEYKKTEKLIHDTTGFSIDKLEKAKDAGITDEDIEKLIIQKQSASVKTEKLDMIAAIKSHDKYVEKIEQELNPTILKDQEEYIEKSQKKLKENLEKANQETKKRYSNINTKVGEKETRFFLNEEYKGHCQICGFTFDKKDNQGKYFETFNWLSQKITKQKLNLVEIGSTLCLCSRCHAILKYGDFESKFLSNIEKTDINLNHFSFNEFCNVITKITNDIEIPEKFDFIEMDMYKLHIKLLNEDAYIFYTEEHLLHFYNILTLVQNS